MEWHYVESGYSQHSDNDGGLGQYLVWSLYGRGHLAMEWHYVESGYSQHSDNDGGLGQYLVWSLYGRGHLAI
jgi:sensor histidine kinase regulating citrate/malate metabolism